MGQIKKRRRKQQQDINIKNRVSKDIAIKKEKERQ